MSKSIDGINIVDTSGPEYVKQEFFKDCEQELIGKAEQEKSVEITQNGTVQVLPDDGNTLSKVTVNTNVGSSTENRVNSLLKRTITEITLDDLKDVKYIYEFAFSSCSKLMSVQIPDTVTRFREHAFEFCFALKSLTIPASVEALQHYSLYACGTIQEKCTFTFLRTTPPSIDSTVFLTNYLNKIIVPAGTGDTYKAATNWSKFADYIEEATE